MVAVEPVRYLITRAPSSRTIRVGPNIVSAGSSPGYFFNKLVTQSGKYEELTIRKTAIDSFKETVQKENQRFNDAISEIVPNADLIRSLTIPVDQYASMMQSVTYSQFGSRPRVFIRTTPPKSLIMRFGQTSFAVIASRRPDADSVVSELKASFNELAGITRDFGLRAEAFLSGQDLVRMMLKSKKDIQATKEQSPKNGFEQEAQTTISNFTAAAIPNISIDFSSPSESFEYDTVVTINDSLNFDIELKDYETVREELHASSTDSWKNRIILAISDKARRLGAVPAIVVRGFPAETFKAVKELADSRRIDLISAEGYEQALPSLICSKLTLSAPEAPTFIPYEQGVFESGQGFEFDQS